MLSLHILETMETNKLYKGPTLFYKRACPHCSGLIGDPTLYASYKRAYGEGYLYHIREDYESDCR